MRRKILILDPIRERDVEKIKRLVSDDFEIAYYPNSLSEEELKKELLNAEVVIGEPPIALLQNAKETCPKLMFIQMTWAGTDIYTLSKLPFPKDRIMLANASGAFGMVMSQYVVGMILSLMLGFKDYHNQQQNKIWARCGRIQSLDHARVLIFGAGDIGTAIAKRLSGFDAYCIGVCRDTSKKREYFQEVCSLNEAEKFIPDADVIVGCIPNSSDTAGFMNKERLSMMKENAVIVNVGRGNFIDCMALNELLYEGKIYGAALDVTNPEPLPTDHPLWENPRCMITPHTSGATFGALPETEDLLCEIICENITRFFAQKEINNRIF